MDPSADDHVGQPVTPDAARVSLRGYYWKNIVATLISQVVVGVLDLPWVCDFLVCPRFLPAGGCYSRYL
jgi:hypothetical protein